MSESTTLLSILEAFWGQDLVNLYLLNFWRHSGSFSNFMPDKWQCLCPGPPWEHGVVAGGGRSEAESRCGTAWPWRISVGSCGQPEFSSWNFFQVLGVHRPWSCLLALLIIHYLWLPSWLLVGPVWFGVGDSYLQSLDQDVHVLMNIMQLWCLAKVGAWETWMGPEMGLLVLICATFNFTLRLGQCYSSLSSSGQWFTAARNSQEVEINMVVRKWVVSACPSMSTMSLGPTALMCWRSHYEWSKIVFFFFFLHTSAVPTR